MWKRGENAPKDNKLMWKRGEIVPKEQFLLFSTIFSVYLYFQESNYIFICEMCLFGLSFFLNSANLICRDTDISKYVRESLGLRDNESRLYVGMTSAADIITTVTIATNVILKYFFFIFFRENKI